MLLFLLIFFLIIINNQLVIENYKDEKIFNLCNPHVCTAYDNYNPSPNPQAKFIRDSIKRGDLYLTNFSDDRGCCAFTKDTTKFIGSHGITPKAFNPNKALKNNIPGLNQDKFYF